MAQQSSSSDVSTPNFNREPISDEDVIRGFILALGAGGGKQKTLTICEDSIPWTELISQIPLVRFKRTTHLMMSSKL